jgi:PTH1 family peptidyl-tRNA hydrolase
MKYLLVGLGNIGPAYAKTRHNVGFMIVDSLAQQHDAIFASQRYGTVAEVKYRGRRIHLLKPATYMNESGKAVRYWMEKLSIPTAKLLIFLDDISLPVGKIRIRPQGGDGGHNGLKSIHDALGHNSYPRLRFGIGNDFGPSGQSNYVLDNFSASEMPILEHTIDHATKVAASFCFQGLAQTMNKYNVGRVAIPSPSLSLEGEDDA